MKPLTLFAITLTALTVLAGPLAEANAQGRRSARPTTARDRNTARHQRAGTAPSALTPADYELCILNEATGAGIRTVTVRPEVARNLQASFPTRFAFTGEEVCGNGQDDDCDGTIDQDCPPVPGPAVCGNGIVEGSEACDDGNAIPNDGCFECEIEIISPPPAGGLWFAGPACDTCMATECAAEGNECLSDSNCDLPRTCVGEANCLSRVTGPLGCICGNELSVAECAAKTDGFEGDCADAILGVGITVPPGGAPLLPATPGFKATQAFRCMARACRSECDDNFYTP